MNHPHRRLPLLERLREESDQLAAKREKVLPGTRKAEAEVERLDADFSEKLERATDAEKRLEEKESEHVHLTGVSASEYNALCGDISDMQQEIKEAEPHRKRRNADSFALTQEIETHSEKLEVVREAATAAVAKTQSAMEQMTNSDGDLQRTKDLLAQERQRALDALRSLQWDKQYLEDLRQKTHAIKNHVQVFYVAESGSYARPSSTHDGAGKSSGSTFPFFSTGADSTPRFFGVAKEEASTSSSLSADAKGQDALQHLSKYVAQTQTPVSGANVRVDEVIYRDEVFRDQCMPSEVVDTPPWENEGHDQNDMKKSHSTDPGQQEKKSDSASSDTRRNNSGRRSIPNSISKVPASGGFGTKMNKKNTPTKGVSINEASSTGSTTSTLTRLTEENRRQAHEKIAEKFVREVPYVREKLEKQHQSGCLVFVGESPELFQMVASKVETAFNETSYSMLQQQLQAVTQDGANSGEEVPMPAASMGRGKCASASGATSLGSKLLGGTKATSSLIGGRSCTSKAAGGSSDFCKTSIVRNLEPRTSGQKRPASQERGRPASQDRGRRSSQDRNRATASANCNTFSKGGGANNFKDTTYGALPPQVVVHNRYKLRTISRAHCIIVGSKRLRDRRAEDQAGGGGSTSSTSKVFLFSDSKSGESHSSSMFGGATVSSASITTTAFSSSAATSSSTLANAAFSASMLLHPQKQLFHVIDSATNAQKLLTEEERQRQLFHSLPDPEVQPSFSVIHVYPANAGRLCELFNALQPAKSNRGGGATPSSGLHSATSPLFGGSSSSLFSMFDSTAGQLSSSSSDISLGGTKPGSSTTTSTTFAAGKISSLTTGSQAAQFVYGDEDDSAAPMAIAVTMDHVKNLLHTPHAGYFAVVLEDPTVPLLATALRWRHFDSRGGLALSEHDRKNSEHDRRNMSGSAGASSMIAKSS
ncbi:unnamed protein product [Amoebophrya sp. A25]|nr:unnamed protein product [Amoebophrya sp. A25]|eukprot:GSA25T00005412001.1